MHACLAALANPKRKVLRVLATRNAASRLPKISCPVEEVDPRVIEKRLGQDSVHQGIAAEVEPLDAPDFTDVLAHKKPIIMLDQVSDPHNIGAILRSAAAFDIAAVVGTHNHMPKENAVIAKTASGGLEVVSLAYVTNLVDAIKEAKKTGYWVAGMDGAASQSLHEANLDQQTIIVMGAEGKGLRRLTGEQCDLLIKLPMSDRMESLNVSNAAAIAAYELFKGKQIYLIVALLLLTATPVFANTSNVSSPVINKDKGNIEFRSGDNVDDSFEGNGQYNQRLHVDYGFTDWYGVQFIANQRYGQGEGWSYRATDMEHKFQLFEGGVDGFDGGFRLVYRFADGANKPDNVNFRGLLRVPDGRHEYRHNVIVTRELGADAENGKSLETRWQWTYKMDEGYRLGLEMFNRFGKLDNLSGFNNQGHQLGPVMKGTLYEDIKYQTGVLAGVSEGAPDEAFKLFLTQPF
jgi:23S rRNA (guanosine2251-2'-O)-methyltransferase